MSHLSHSSDPFYSFFTLLFHLLPTKDVEPEDEPLEVPLQQPMQEAEEYLSEATVDGLEPVEATPPLSEGCPLAAFIQRIIRELLKSVLPLPATPAVPPRLAATDSTRRSSRLAASQMQA